jgi:hypothetical protein
MQTRLTTILKTKFNILNPRQLVKELNKIGKIDSRSLRKPFEDTPPERFNIEIIKKYIEYVSSHSNIKSVQYEPEYWMYRKNISYEDAVQLIKQNKIDKRTSKEGFVMRHGEKLGLELFEQFQKTSAYSTSDDWFKEKYGDNWENVKKYEMKKRSKRCVEYWINLGYSLNEAENAVSQHQKSSSGIHREYYKKMGYSEEEIDIIIFDINKRKKNHSRNTAYLKEKYPDSWKEKYLETSEKYRKRMEELGTWIEQSIIDDFKKYRLLVIKYTNKSLLFYGQLVENLELRSREFHLDHKYSIKMGFLNDIEPEIIGSVVNIEILPAKINSSKRMKCSITKNQLFKDYQQFTEDYENYKN